MRRALVMLSVLLALAVSASAEVVVAIHGHSNFSDGSQDLAQTFVSMRSGGAQAAIITDHAECFLKQVGGKWVADDEKVEQWKTAYRAISYPPTLYSVGGIDIFDTTKPAAEACVIPAMEVGLFAKEADRNNRFCHFLFVGGSVEDQTYNKLVALVASDRAVDFATAKSVLAEIVELAHRVGAVVIAAHPTNPDHIVGPDLLELVDGAEAMNESMNPLAFKDNAESFVSVLPNVGGSGIVTSGIDWHDIVRAGIHVQQGVVDTFRRHNIVLADQANPAAIMEALRSGRTYAAKDDVRITCGAELIGSRVEQSDPLAMEFSGLEGIFGRKASIACRSADGICRDVKECSLKGNELSIPDLGKFLGPSMAGGGRIYVCVPGEFYCSVISVSEARHKEPPRVVEKPKRERKGPSTGQQIAGFLLDLLGGGGAMNLRGDQADGQLGIPPPIEGAGRFVSAPRVDPGYFSGTTAFVVLDLLPDLNGRLFLRAGDQIGVWEIRPENWNGGRHTCQVNLDRRWAFQAPRYGETRFYMCSGFSFSWAKGLPGGQPGHFKFGFSYLSESEHGPSDWELATGVSLGAIGSPRLDLFPVDGATWDGGY